jgi:hypothetical protein
MRHHCHASTPLPIPASYGVQEAASKSKPARSHRRQYVTLCAAFIVVVTKEEPHPGNPD